MNSINCGLKPGSILRHNTYRIERILGQGGFGITYLAKDLYCERYVAIKEFFPKEYCDRDESSSHITIGTRSNTELVSRLKAKFLREARNIARLDHPGIIKIHAAFEENNTAYYVMDYIEGRNLSEIVKGGGPIAAHKAIKYISQVGDALEYIHSKRINHLDVKPANIMIRRSDDQPILIDFGLSKQYDSDGNQESTTPLGVSHGYAPIEQYMPGGVSEFSPRSDVYSLAATLYYILSGIIPPYASSLSENALTFPPGFPVALQSPITKAMSRSRQDRYGAVPQFVDSIKRTMESGILTQQRRRMSSISSESANSEATKIYQDPSAEVVQTSPTQKIAGKKNPKYTWIWIIVVVIGICGLVWFVKNIDQNKYEANTNYGTETVESALPGKIDDNNHEINSVQANEQNNSGTTSNKVVSYNTFRLGGGYINVPDFLSYKGESDDGGPMFSDNTGNIRLFADFLRGQDLENYHWWVSNEVGYGKPALEISKNNYMVQSGYTHAREIYYAKWYIDNSTNPSMMYTLIIIYPQSEKTRLDNVIPKIFNKFPNIR